MRGRVAVLTATLGLSCALAFTPACGPTDSSTQLQEPPRLIVLYLIDTLRRDRLGLYGYDRGTSPNIDALGSESLVFEDAHTPAPWTLPSVVSLFTSTYPIEHGAVEIRRKLGPEYATLSERLRGLGYRTAYFGSNPIAGKAAGLDRGWDLMRMKSKGRYAALSEVTAWIDQDSEAPAFLYIHTMEPHRPYIAPKHLLDRFGDIDPEHEKETASEIRRYRVLKRIDWKDGKALGSTDNTDEQLDILEMAKREVGMFSDLYDASVAWADENVGSLVAMLKQRGIWDQTLFVLLSDHGQEFFDHGNILHGQSIYRELVGAPLVWHLPGETSPRGRIESSVALLDVMPTILEFAGAPEPERSTAGQSLLPLMRGPRVARFAKAEPRIVSMRIERMNYFRPLTEIRGNLNLSVLEGRWKGIWNVEPGSFELYDLRADPREQRDLAAEEPATVARLRSFAEDWLAGRREATGGAAAEIDDATLERMRELGYIN